MLELIAALPNSRQEEIYGLDLSTPGATLGLIVAHLRQTTDILVRHNLDTPKQLQERIFQLQMHWSNEATERMRLMQELSAKKEDMNNWLQAQYQQLARDLPDSKQHNHHHHCAETIRLKPTSGSSDQDDSSAAAPLQDQTAKQQPAVMMTAQRPGSWAAGYKSAAAHAHELEMMCGQLHLRWEAEARKVAALQDKYSQLLVVHQRVKTQLRERAAAHTLLWTRFKQALVSCWLDAVGLKDVCWQVRVEACACACVESVQRVCLSVLVVGS